MSLLKIQLNLLNILSSITFHFCHRSRGKEKKDGNPLNEVRILCNSMMTIHNIMDKDKTIKFKPDKSNLTYKVGEEIKLNKGDFVLLSKVFFDEIESIYVG